MEFHAADEPDTALDMDVRTVSVIWTDRGDESGEPDVPEVDHTGCSPYEALGLLLVGFVELLLDNLPEREQEEDD